MREEGEMKMGWSRGRERKAWDVAGAIGLTCLIDCHVKTRQDGFRRNKLEGEAKEVRELEE